MILRALLFLLLSAQAAAAEQVVLGLSQDEVAITARFDGSQILIFGAVKRDRPPQEPPLEVIITVTGPDAPVVVHRKARRWGIWMNSDNVPIWSAPTFYAVATSAPLGEILSETEDLRHQITIDRAMRTVGASGEAADVESFTESLIRIRTREGLYQNLEGRVVIDEQTLFRTEVALPSNLTEGDYATRIFLLRDGAVVDLYETAIEVRKVGLERWLFNRAQDDPAFYGLMAIALAVAAGWMASAGFQLLRR